MKRKKPAVKGGKAAGTPKQSTQKSQPATKTPAAGDKTPGQLPAAKPLQPRSSAQAKKAASAMQKALAEGDAVMPSGKEASTGEHSNKFMTVACGRLEFVSPQWHSLHGRGRCPEDLNLSSTIAIVPLTADIYHPAVQTSLNGLVPWHHCHGQQSISVQVLWSFVRMLRALPAARANSPSLRPSRSGTQTSGGQTTPHTTPGPCTSLQTGSRRLVFPRARGSGALSCMHHLVMQQCKWSRVCPASGLASHRAGTMQCPPGNTPSYLRGVTLFECHSCSCSLHEHLADTLGAALDCS